MPRVTRPVKSEELRVTGLDNSVSQEELERAICATGECARSSLRMGNIRRAANGLGAVWVRCPLASALRLEKAGRIKVGWTHAVVRLLEERPLQCYKCLLWGHTTAACKGQVDRTGRCFNCGGAGHVARDCTARSRCPVCDVAGELADHRMGGPACATLKKRVAKKRGSNAPPPVRKKGGKGGLKGGGDCPPAAPRARPAAVPRPPPEAAPAPAGMELSPPPDQEEEVSWERRPSPEYGEEPPSHGGADEADGEDVDVLTVEEDPSQVPADLEMGDWEAPSP